MRGFDRSERPIGEKNYMLPYLIGDLKALIKYLSEWAKRKIKDSIEKFNEHPNLQIVRNLCL